MREEIDIGNVHNNLNTLTLTLTHMHLLYSSSKHPLRVTESRLVKLSVIVPRYHKRVKQLAVEICHRCVIQPSVQTKRVRRTVLADPPKSHKLENTHTTQLTLGEWNRQR